MNWDLYIARKSKQFAEKVDTNGPVHPVLGTRCHLWTGAKFIGGYGQTKFKGEVELAHRVAFFLKHGRWPDPCCLHKCDNPPCVNDDHLFEGTHADNSADMVAKGRVKGWPKGKKRGRAWNVGMPMSEEAKAKLRKLAKLRPIRRGWKHSAESKIKISLAMKRKAAK